MRWWCSPSSSVKSVRRTRSGVFGLGAGPRFRENLSAAWCSGRASGFLEGDNSRIPCVVPGNGVFIRFRQLSDMVGKAASIPVVDLQCWRCAFGVVESAGRDFDLIVVEVLQAQRCTAFSAKAALADVGTLEQTAVSPRPLQAFDYDQRRIERTEGTLAHPAVAHRRTPERRDAIAYRTTLASACYIDVPCHVPQVDPIAAPRPEQRWESRSDIAGGNAPDR